MAKLPPAARTDACGVSDAKSTGRGRAGDESLKSDPSNGNCSSRAWFGDQNKHGYQKFDVEMRYYHLVSNVYY